MRCVGADLSLRSTGYAIGTEHGIAFGTLDKQPKGMSDLQRLDWITNTVGELCKDSDLVVLEDFSFGSRGHQHEIGAMGYMVRRRLWKRDIPYVLVAPAANKKFATGKGNADKNVVMKEIYKRYGHDCNSDDACDALALLHIALCLMGHEDPQTDAQRQVIEALMVKNAEVIERARKGWL